VASLTHVWVVVDHQS